MSSATSIPELLLQILEHLPLRDLISAMHVNQQWRAIVPAIDSPTRVRLLGLAFSKVDTPHSITLSDRISYVDKIETTHVVIIPEPYRTILTEWPSSHPPSGMHWPHSVRYHASGFCFCFRYRYETPDCHCAEHDVSTFAITLPNVVLSWVMTYGTTPGPELASSGELFNCPVRLHTEEQNAQTIRFIRAHAASEWRGGSWRTCKFKVLELSRYNICTEDGKSSGVFVMMLEGPTRGQIHGWSEGGYDWYDGFEAETFWDWKYVKWERDTEADEQTARRPDNL
ncbi:hypothetical protein GGX14DRAFT_664498 [Mycena pura]|uniref:F-box domain-containing protein n=1 Tax=Mycena pura TaxID=153505 RepID=A0AAD6YLL1_9AGAR|nr:hypothetical protein GGX14DRAFT_664498 [Mycena pura]